MLNEVSINFVNLGIKFNDLGSSISIFGFDIAFYGIIIAIGMIVGILIALREAKITGQDPGLYVDFALYVIIASIIGARLYYVILEWDQYQGDLLKIINIRNGGLAIYGGIIAAVITCIIFAKVKKYSFWKMTDTACLGLVAGQAIGRWGNFFNREAFGEYTNGLFAMQIKLSDVRGVVTDKMMNHLVDINGVSYIQVHPTFLYESLWNIGVLICLLIFKKYKKFDGEVFLWYIWGYALGRVWIEGLRTDQLIIGFLNLPISQLLSAVLLVVVGVFWIYKRVKIGKIKKLDIN